MKFEVHLHVNMQHAELRGLTANVPVPETIMSQVRAVIMKISELSKQFWLTEYTQLYEKEYFHTVLCSNMKNSIHPVIQ